MNKLFNCPTSDWSGFTVLERVPGELEIWDYWTDELVHRIFGPPPRPPGIASNWAAALDWAQAHSQIPFLPERCWPSEYPDGERPRPYRPARQQRS